MTRDLQRTLKEKLKGLKEKKSRTLEKLQNRPKNFKNTTLEFLERPEIF